MTPQEVSKVLGLPFEKLFELAHNREDFARIISIAYNEGIALENRRVCRSYNSMFRGYNKVSINN